MLRILTSMMIWLLTVISLIFRGCRNEPGFLKMFNGYWGVEPRMVNGKSMGCNVVVKQEVLPSMLPPGPLGTAYNIYNAFMWWKWPL